MNRKAFIIIAGVFIILVFLFLIFSALTRRTGNDRQPLPTPTPIIVNEPPKPVQTLPTIPFSQGGGVDTKAQTVEESTQEVAKLYPYLPYSTALELSTGVSVSIQIPEKALQNQPWTLTVQVFGINYQTSPEQEDYDLMKRSFREAATGVFAWIKSHEADPSKMYIVWGDRSYIQNIAEEWLK